MVGGHPLGADAGQVTRIAAVVAADDDHDIGWPVLHHLLDGILLEDLLDHCNLKCPTCFAESAPALASVAFERAAAKLPIRTKVVRRLGEMEQY